MPIIREKVDLEPRGRDLNNNNWFMYLVTIFQQIKYKYFLAK